MNVGTPYLIINVPFLLFYAKMGVMNIINLYDNYNSYFSADLKQKFKILSNAVQEFGCKIYLIGGIVRDILLARENLDIDISIQGDAIEFAKYLEEKKLAEISELHHDFSTAKIKMGTIKIDLASTRYESYPKKGHLPKVDKIACDLKEDVSRRDFTINSLALSLNMSDFGDLVDYVGGFEDLKDGKIRILHPESFIDDPTRILRAIKFAFRFGFIIEEETLSLMRKYLQSINYDMGKKRLKNEIILTFDQNIQSAFDFFVDEKIYKLLTQNELKSPKTNIAELINKYPVNHPWLIYFGLIAINENDDFLEEFKLTKSEKSVILGAKSLLKENLTDKFNLCKAFGASKPESILIYSALNGENKAKEYYSGLDKIKLQINGNDLIKLGFTAGEKFQKAFDLVLQEKILNPQMSKAEELSTAQNFLK